MTARLFIIVSFTALLAGCVANPNIPAWNFYDQCAYKSPSFIEMANCGRKERQAYCTAHKNCMPDGDFFVRYADSLVTSVRNGEITEAEAQRRWIEFRASQVNAYQQQKMLSAPRPMTCFSTGGLITDCY